MERVMEIEPTFRAWKALTISVLFGDFKILSLLDISHLLFHRKISNKILIYAIIKRTFNQKAGVKDGNRECISK
ncbi:MAG TPA: hypothetical protein PKD52_01905 [Clostridiales bacterium]|nr:hypothetical protein [Clostridiales bacterium]